MDTILGLLGLVVYIVGVVALAAGGDVRGDQDLAVAEREAARRRAEQP